MKSTGFTGKILKHQSPLHYPPEAPLVQSLLNVYREATGDQTPPVAIGGGTYARRLPNTVAFGPYRRGRTRPSTGKTSASQLTSWSRLRRSMLTRSTNWRSECEHKL